MPLTWPFLVAAALAGPAYFEGVIQTPPVAVSPAAAGGVPLMVWVIVDGDFPPQPIGLHAAAERTMLRLVTEAGFATGTDWSPVDEFRLWVQFRVTGSKKEPKVPTISAWIKYEVNIGSGRELIVASVDVAAEPGKEGLENLGELLGRATAALTQSPKLGAAMSIEGFDFDEMQRAMAATTGAAAPAAAQRIGTSLPPIDAPAPQGPAAPSDAAVVLAVEDYAFLPDVPFALRDGDAFEQTARTAMGIPRDRILRPTVLSRESMLRTVEAGAGLVGEGGTLWVYFSGHGAAAPSSGERLLLGDDTRADPAVFEERAVRLAEVEQVASRTGARVVMVLDTCYAGQGRSGQDLIAGTRFAVPTYALSTSSEVLHWAAAMPGELSRPLDAAQHGAFTYFTVGALRGWADGVLSGGRDGEITVGEVREYVERALGAVDLRSQHPAWLGGDDATVVVRGVSEVGPELF